MDGGLPDVVMPPVECREGQTLGQSCLVEGDCQDGCFCNGREACAEGSCAPGDAVTCDDRVGCTTDLCDEAIDRCMAISNDDICSDGDACNGTERCGTGGCMPGTPPSCNDEDRCTVDSCDAELGCVFQPRDLDADGWVDLACGGDDCDDDPRFGTDVHPAATEICDNRRDDDCDGNRDFDDPACAPDNDTCELARVLPGPGIYSGSTRGLGSDYSLGCSPWTGRADAVFRFTLTEPQNVTVTASGLGYDGVLAIREWDQCSDGPDHSCVGRAPLVASASLLPGDYAVVVADGGEAHFDLSLSFSEATPVIDGVVTEAEWARAEGVANSVTSDWGRDLNELRRLRAQVVGTDLYFAVEGRVETRNAIVVYIGNETVGVEPSRLSDEAGAVDAALSAPLHTGTFRASVGWGTRSMSRFAHAWDDQMGFRDLDEDPSDLHWIHSVEAPSACSANACEGRIPLSLLGGSPVSLFARLTNGSGEVLANQCLPEDDPRNPATVGVVLTLP